MSVHRHKNVWDPFSPRPLGLPKPHGYTSAALVPLRERGGKGEITCYVPASAVSNMRPWRQMNPTETGSQGARGNPGTSPGPCVPGGGDRQQDVAEVSGAQ